MSSVTLDLPAGVLEAAARLAQQRNVPRSEIFALAIAAWSRAEAIEAELAAARAEIAGREGDLAAARRELDDARAAANALAGDLAETRKVRDAALAARKELEDELVPLRGSLAAAREEVGKVRAMAEAAGRRAAELEDLDRKKVLAVMKDADVARLRARGQELMLSVQKLEKDLEYGRIAAGLAAKKLRSTEEKLSAAVRAKRSLETRVRSLQKESFAAERQVGLLMRDRARLRQELRRVAAVINRGPAGDRPAVSRRPKPTRKETTE